MHPLSLRSGRALALTALLAALLGILLVVPAAFAQTPAGEEYGEGFPGAPSDGGATSPKRPAPDSGGGRRGGSAPGGGASSGGEARLGPDSSAADSGSGFGFGSGSGSGSTAGGSSDGGLSSPSAESNAEKALDGRSLGEVLAGGTERVTSGKPAASTDVGRRAAQEGGSGLLWLLLALGAITAVAAGGVAVRRRQAQQGYGS